MKCKICGQTAVMFLSKLLKDSRFGRKCDYYNCLSCDFSFTPSFDSLTTDDWEQFYKYPEYLNQDEWAKLEWLGEGPGRTDILLKSLETGEKILGYIPEKILIYGNGLSKALKNLNDISKYNGCVYAVDSYTKHPNEIQKKDHQKYFKYFDCVISTEVFEHFSNPIEEFRKSSFFLKTKGCIVGTTGAKEKYKEVFPNDPYRYLTAQPLNGHLSYYSKKSIQIISDKLHFTNYTDIADTKGHDSRKWRIAFLKE